MRLPDFIIIGAPKSATTTLVSCLRKHPQIFISTPKEIGYFSRDYLYERGLDWYSNFFKEAKPEQVCGEASTEYSGNLDRTNTVERMYSAIPNIKLLYLMRHPVDRAYSHYLHKMRALELQGKIKSGQGITFEDAIEEHKEILDFSHYIKQINRYLSVFSRSSFHFALTDDFIGNIDEELVAIYDFLGIDKYPKQLDMAVEKHYSKTILNESVTRSKALQPLRSMPGYRQILNFFPKEVKDRIYEFVKNSFYGNLIEKQRFIPFPMLPETRQHLLNLFSGSNQELSCFLGRDLSAWSR
ncbi:sulfotransferase domain-containing protein [Synechococcus sp. PCC 7336]|uniref:sulfotransferase domain-containing protein n=1 Tax=Synechococcus sp. PCC 7336 TaxID=195250 RepID=UPI00034B879F|nr:sulfotransferase domain-containing protein [Synechococcus sp. PCC 7336]